MNYELKCASPTPPKEGHPPPSGELEGASFGEIEGLTKKTRKPWFVGLHAFVIRATDVRLLHFLDDMAVLKAVREDNLNGNGTGTVSTFLSPETRKSEWL